MKWFEEYKCGCVSDFLPKRELLGYCPIHGADTRYIYPESLTDNDNKRQNKSKKTVATVPSHARTS